MGIHRDIWGREGGRETEKKKKIVVAKRERDRELHESHNFHKIYCIVFYINHRFIHKYTSKISIFSF